MKQAIRCFPIALAALLSSCVVGPKYERPPAPVPAAFKEPPPEGWKEAQPNEGQLRGKWWEIFNDPDLNALEEQVSISNQNVLAAEAQFREAKDLIRIAHASLYPTATAGVSTTMSQAPFLLGGTAGKSFSNRVTSYETTGGLSWTADIWGSIRRSVRQDVALAQASDAQLENARLAYQSDLAADYFELHGIDGDIDLLTRTVKEYEDYLTLTESRMHAGVASGSDVAQAQTQLEQAKVALVDLGVARAQTEHAIAVLIGKPPAEFSVPPKVLTGGPPRIPVGVPSGLLERRPDVAANERQMAAALEQVGITQAAFYPNLTLSANGGFESLITSPLAWGSRLFSLGSSLTETVYDAGKRHAAVNQAKAAFDATVANYRQTVLSAFQQVEDSLAALRVLEQEAAEQDAYVSAANKTLDLTTLQYKAGTTDYLTVITSQTAAFTAERGAVDLRTRRLQSSVLLIQALGGGWDASQLPTRQQLMSPATAAAGGGRPAQGS
ncbi:MAG TPA: efflux transporter outer membrane subunit [Bryobacteraceae bacterium]|nr:efflux transporter outer membrane subunit [Bryobacteraceae bacterium]